MKVIDCSKIFDKAIDLDLLTNLFGVEDINLKYLHKIYGFEIKYQDGFFVFETDDKYKEEILNKHLKLLLLKAKKNSISESDVLNSYEIVKKFPDDYLEIESSLDNIYGYTSYGKPIRAKTLGQKKLLDCINNKTVTFAKGPAGSGKTFLAVLMAVNALKKGECKKIVLSRPAVEAGENLGFLPGDLKEKVDPYLSPLYDCLSEFFGQNKMQQLIEKQIIEVAPLAYMRGRTLNESFIILDEAQNTTSAQMKMFLTRLGFNSKMVICGDVTQVDLNLKEKNNGLKQALKILRKIDDIGICELEVCDVVRNSIVLEIIKRYEESSHNKLEFEKR